MKVWNGASPGSKPGLCGPGDGSREPSPFRSFSSSAFAPSTAAGDRPREIVVSRLTLVDDKGVARVVIGQDPVDSKRRSRGAGVYIRDRDGNERGGFGTMDDGSAVFAMDAPRGVGTLYPDRIGMMVWPHGGSQMMLLDNKSRSVVQLRANGDGEGGLDLFNWQPEKVDIRTLNFGGESRESEKLSAPAPAKSR
ncbi:MAG: hypothetical protein QOG72_2211 [Sphingomonadales bacterium]|jgi:hypothetical protein|nr:hypothetical protein [Sphingomonadales bacterium]